MRKVTEADREAVLDIVRKWGADFVVTRGRKVYPTDIDGFLAESNDGAVLGLATYEIIDDQCELVTLDAFEQWQGLGTALVRKVIESALAAGCKRLWLITTNDNLDAVRFYQRRGFTLTQVHAGAIEESRKIKPSIPTIGSYEIPIRDELEFEMEL